MHGEQFITHLCVVLLSYYHNQIGDIKKKHFSLAKQIGYQMYHVALEFSHKKMKVSSFFYVGEINVGTYIIPLYNWGQSGGKGDSVLAELKLPHCDWSTQTGGLHNLT